MTTYFIIYTMQASINVVSSLNAICETKSSSSMSLFWINSKNSIQFPFCGVTSCTLLAAQPSSNSRMDNSRLARQIDFSLGLCEKLAYTRLTSSFFETLGRPSFLQKLPFCVRTVGAQRPTNRKRNGEPSAKIVSLYNYRFSHLGANKECIMPLTFYRLDAILTTIHLGRRPSHIGCVSDTIATIVNQKKTLYLHFSNGL